MRVTMDSPGINPIIFYCVDTKQMMSLSDS